jgi:hypothetical protein
LPDSDSSPVIRPYRRDDEHELTQLFARAFGHAITEDRWRWKLKQHPFAVENVWVATSEDKIVFQYAGVPLRFWLAQTPVLAMVSVDTMTAPDSRRRGLLTLVAPRVYEAWRQQDVSFVIGLPNEKWGSRAQALGWQAFFPLQWLVRPLRPEAIIARWAGVPLLRHVTLPATLWNYALKKRLRRDPGVSIESVTVADERFDQIWSGCKTDWMFSTVRDRDWVQRRFLSAPQQGYQVTLARRDAGPTGYAAHRVIRTEGRVIAHLAELIAGRADDATRDSLLSDLVAALKPIGAESLFTLALPGTEGYHWLRRAGFIARHSFLVQLVPLKEGLPLTLMRDPRQWNLTGADFDVI